jgi:uncharacterized protein YndB with AHSA1/START domain
MPKATHTVEIDAPRSAVFAIIDDVGRTPEWQQRCINVEKLSPGPNSVGTNLRYTFKDGPRTGQMTGRITAREPDERFSMEYADKLMRVGVDFVLRDGATSSSTSLTHAVDVHGRGLGRLFAPIATRTLPRQTVNAVESLKAIAEHSRA